MGRLSRPPRTILPQAYNSIVNRVLEVRRLDVVPYAEALELQRELVEQRRVGLIPDVLLLLQHPHVITLGSKRGGRSNVLATDALLAAKNVEIHETGRGGDVTYHGPGQIVGYPILDLRPDRCDVHRYVRDLEEAMIRVCAEYGVAATRVPGLTGAWAVTERGPEKIGAIGVRISRWITSHGFAFNATTDLDYFQLIVPCGIAGRGVTSLNRLSRRTVSLPELEDAFTRHFSEVFEREVTSCGGGALCPAQAGPKGPGPTAPELE
jgi:lipoyl(octanoyl) transferase